MANTIRELIIAELTALFEAYPFEAIALPAVHRGRQVFDPDVDPPPLISILARQEESERIEYGIDRKTMRVDIICLEHIGTQNPSVLGEAILGELLACTFGQVSEAGGVWTKTGGMTQTYADDVIYKSGGIDAYPDQAGQQILHVGITVTVIYQTKPGDPYNQT